MLSRHHQQIQPFQGHLMYKSEIPEFITLGLFFLGFIHPLFFGLLALYVIIALWVGSSKPELLDEFTLPSGSSRQVDPQLANFMYMKRKYLLSDNWRQKREAVLRRDRYCCMKCFTSTSLNVHHIRYSALPNEPIEDLVTLCESCHTALHNTSGYPQTYADYMRWNQPLKELK